MIKIGKVYQNLMVDMVPTNAKLKLRAEQIVYEVTGASLDSIRRTLEGSSYNIKTAIVMLKANCQLEAAEALLVRAEGVVGRALQIVAKEGMGSEGTKEEDVQ